MYVDKSLTLPDIFERVAKQETVEEKAKMLLRYDTSVMRWFIDAIYNRDYTTLEIPEYKKSDRPTAVNFMNMKQAMPRVDVALKHADNKRVVERNLLLVLENISASEAELIEMIIKGEKRVKGVSKSVFKKAYPQFFREA